MSNKKAYRASDDNALAEFIYVKSNIIISSSSSGLLPSKIYSKCKNPARTMIGHPFNPVYMCPGVEIVPGKKTKKNLLIIT